MKIGIDVNEDYLMERIRSPDRIPPEGIGPSITSPAD